MKAVRELGLDRRETGRSLSVVGAGDLSGSFPSTRGLGTTHLWCASRRASGAEIYQNSGLRALAKHLRTGGHLRQGCW